jgi:LicD family
VIASTAAHPPCSATSRNCRFWDWGGGHVRPDCCTEHLLELIVFVHRLLAERGILHWLDFGTLLGAVRDGALIPWDHDADFGILTRDAEAVLTLRDEIERPGHRLFLGDPAVIRVHYSEVNRLGLDLTLWHERRGLLVSAESPLDLWPGMHDRTSFPAAFLERLTEVQLEGRRFPAPSPADRLLAEYRYGPDWRTPTRPIVSAATRQIVPSTEMTAAARELLPRIADRDAVLRALLWNGREGRVWESRAGRWFVRAGLPPEPAPADGGEDDPALAHARRSLAWTEQAIAEYERPPRLIGARRLGRRVVRLARYVRQA